MVRIRRSRFVEADVLAIWRWIARRDRDAADRVVQNINAAFRVLVQFPRSGSPRDDIKTGIRSHPVGNYLILYRVDRDAPFVLRVVHGAMDLSRLRIG